jgi:hypothetical protein
MLSETLNTHVILFTLPYPYRRLISRPQQHNERKGLRRESRKALSSAILSTDGTLSTEVARMQPRIIERGAACFDRQPHPISHLLERYQIS